MKISFKIGMVLVGIILLFIFLNPSRSRFKEFLGYHSEDGLKRTSNLFVYSIYEDDNLDGDPSRYYGFLLNFVKINTATYSFNNNNKLDSVAVDSTKIIDTTSSVQPKRDKYGIVIRK